MKPFQMRRVRQLKQPLPKVLRKIIWRQPYQTFVSADLVTRPELIAGIPGTGKTRYMQTKFITWCVRQGKAGAWIDVMGDVFDDLKLEIALEARRDRSLLQRVVLIDADDEDSTVGFNPLEPLPGFTQEENAAHVFSMLKHILGLGAETPRLNWLLKNTFTALADRGLTLLDAQRWWLDKKFREQEVEQLTIQSAYLYWTHTFPSNPNRAEEWLSPALSRVGSLLFGPASKRILGSKSNINIRQAMDSRKIVLARYPKGLSEESSYLLAGFTYAAFEKGAYSRKDLDKDDRQPCLLVLDEFPNFVSPSVGTLMAEVRKYKLIPVLACQSPVGQLSTELRHVVLGTVGSISCFQVAYADAQVLAKEIFPSQYFLDGMPVKEGPGWTGLTLQLTNQENRSYWYFNRTEKTPVKVINTPNRPDIPRTPEVDFWVSQLEEANEAINGVSVIPGRAETQEYISDDVVARQGTTETPEIVPKLPVDSQGEPVTMTTNDLVCRDQYQGEGVIEDDSEHDFAVDSPDDEEGVIWIINSPEEHAA